MIFNFQYRKTHRARCFSFLVLCSSHGIISLVATSKPEPVVPSGSGQLSLFTTIQNRLEPNGTASHPAVGF